MMGYISDGQWHQGDIPVQDGQFVREPSVFRDRVSKEEVLESPNRFELYVSYACPWAHRTLIFRQLKGLESVIKVHVVEAYMGDKGWSFETPEPNIGAKYLHELYLQTKGYHGKVTVPVLWDTHLKCIRNNESSEIIAMLNEVWNSVVQHPERDLIPKDKQAEINTLNDWIYESINNGVYRAGFATDQDVYEKECRAVFAALDELEVKLSDREYLLGDSLLEPDIRLFVTLIRFDIAYVGHFKCNIRRIADYPNLSKYVKNIYAQVKDTVHVYHIKSHYYMSHPRINPNKIVPVGPLEDLD